MSKAHVRSNQSQTKAANKTPVRPYADVAAARSPRTDTAAARPYTGTAATRPPASPAHEHEHKHKHKHGHKEAKPCSPV